MSKRIFFLLSLICFSFQAFAAVEPLKIQRVTPLGTDIKQTDKIVFEFNQPVVALGQMERTADEIPIKITPALNCQWRWLNQTSLACILGKDDGLKAATAYQIEVKPDFKSLSGAKMQDKTVYEIETVRPEINVSDTLTRGDNPGYLTPERPRWTLFFNADPQMQSVQSHVFFKVDGKKIKVDISPVQCFSWDQECKSKFLVWPVKDLGVDQAYELVFEKGIKALDGGDLRSEKEGVIAREKTLPVFGVSRLKCYDSDYNSRLFTPEETRLTAPQCSFDYPISIVFTDSALLENISSFIQATPRVSVTDSESFSKSVMVSAPKAGQFYTLEVLPGVSDMWGAKLEKGEKFFFHTSDRRPAINMPYSAVVLEQDEKTDAIGYATNLDQAEIVFNGFTSKKEVDGVHMIADVKADIRNVSYPFNYGIRDLLGGQPGFVYGKIQTIPDLAGQNYFVASVSPWQIMAKIGWSDSLVWVTDMRTGRPIDKAEVQIGIRSPVMSAEKKVLSTVKTDKNGLAFLSGYETLDPGATLLNQWDVNKESLFITVKKGKELGVLPLQNAFSLSADALSDWTISSVYFARPNRHLRVFGFTPQGIYRPGDEVEYKIFVRQADNKVLGKAPASGYHLSVTDSTGRNIFEQKEVVLSDFGAINGKFALPAQAVSGWYDVSLKYKGYTLSAMRFLVSDFTPSAFKSTTEVNGKIFKAGEFVQMTSTANLFSGGAFAGAKMRQTAVLSPVTFTFKDDDESQPFSFWQPGNYDDSPETLFDQEGNADAQGILVKKYELPESVRPYGKIRFETKVFDDSGRSVSSFQTADYFSTDRLVGLRRMDGLADVGNPTVVEYIVAGTNQKPVAGVPVTVSFSRTENKLVREKSAGDAYVLKFVAQEEQVGECMGMSAIQPQKCSFVPDKSGLYKATAKIAGYTSELSIYVQGADYVPWEGSENKLKIVPDKKEYKTGDKISLLVENPVPGAMALVTVERYGILQSFVQPLTGGAPVIEIPATPDFFPGVYVSVALFSPRVDKPVKGEVDLGKPTQWTGYVKIPVVDESKQIEIKVASEKQDYRPGQKVKAEIQAVLPKGSKQPIEASVIVLDEAVLALLPGGIKSFDPYDGLNQLGNLDVRNFSLVERLVGRQNVEKKGANQGGDGGSDFAVRDVFKFVGYFNPSLPLDKDGKASFEMTLPDNLTGWRMIVIAVSPTELSGMGEGRFDVSQPLEVRPLLPNQVRTGDVFNPGVSVLNRTKTPVVTMVSMDISGAVEPMTRVQKEITLQPFERQAVYFERIRAVLKPSDPAGEMALTFRAVAGAEKDGIIQKIPVLNLTTMETAALYGSTLEPKVTVPVEIPDGVKQYGGRFELSVSPSVLNGLAGAVKAMHDYPYPCWEQKIGRALAASVYTREKGAISPEDLWPDADAFVKEILKQAPSYQAENGGMAYFEAKNNYVSPYLSAYTAYAFTRLAVAGYDIPQQVEKKLGDYLLAFFKRTDSLISKQTALTTRLLSAAFLKQKGLITQADISVFLRDLPMMTAFDKALYLSVDPQNKQVLDSLINTSYETSGTMLFKENETNDYAVLASPAKTNCAALAAVANHHPALAESLVRGVYSLRLRNGSWINTQANAFCLTGVQAYAAAVETKQVDMAVKGLFDAKEILTAAFHEKSDPPVTGTEALIPAEAGLKTTAVLMKSGQGRYYYSAALSYPSDLAKSVNAGLEIKRLIAVERGGKFIPVTSDSILKRGDLVRVTLTISNPVNLNFVAVTDPVAGAFEPVNSLLATASSFDEEKTQSDYDFAFKDVGHKTVGFYAEVLGAGTHVVSYAAQVVANGVFTAFPAKAEAMYTPDVFGLTASETITVE